MKVVMLIVVMMVDRSCNDDGNAGGGRRGRTAAGRALTRGRSMSLAGAQFASTCLRREHGAPPGGGVCGEAFLDTPLILSWTPRGGRQRPS